MIRRCFDAPTCVTTPACHAQDMRRIAQNDKGLLTAGSLLLEPLLLRLVIKLFGLVT